MVMTESKVVAIEGPSNLEKNFQGEREKISKKNSESSDTT